MATAPPVPVSLLLVRRVILIVKVLVVGVDKTSNKSLSKSAAIKELEGGALKTVVPLLHNKISPTSKL